MTIQNERDLIGMMEIGRICGQALQHMAARLEPGLSTRDLDAIGAQFLKDHGAASAPITAYKFPGHTCISINEEAAHGIPGDRIIQAGDMVNIDISAVKDGYWGDTGGSFVVPPATPAQQAILDATRQALQIAIDTARAGVPVNEVGKRVEAFARKHGYKIIKDLHGHGIGGHLHESPSIPNHYDKRLRGRFQEGMVLTLEPFLTTGGPHITTQPDGWTLTTAPGKLVAQFEHTVIITKDKPVLLTAV